MSTIPLTNQESKVARLVAKGYIEKEIASELFVSEHTVHTHTRNIRKKWNARNIADITRTYILSLNDPRTLLFCLLFIMIQLGIIFSSTGFDARISKNVRKVPRKVLRRKEGKS